MTRQTGQMVSDTPRPDDWDAHSELQREWMTRYQAAYGAASLSLPDYYLNYMGLLGPSVWWVGAALWSSAPAGPDVFSISGKDLAAFADVSRATVSAAFASEPGQPALLRWLVDKIRDQREHDPHTHLVLPNRFRWRCGLPFTPGQQEAVLRFLAEQFLKARLRKRTLTQKDIVSTVRQILEMPASELRTCLGERHHPVHLGEPMTMREMVATASGVPLREEGELAEALHQLWRALRPDQVVSVPDLIREGWLGKDGLGHGPVWLYLLAVARTLGQRMRLWVLPHGLTEVLALSGASERSLYRWLAALGSAGFLKPVTALSLAAETVIQVTDPQAAPLTASQRAAVAKNVQGGLPRVDMVVTSGQGSLPKSGMFAASGHGGLPPQDMAAKTGHGGLPGLGMDNVRQNAVVSSRSVHLGAGPATSGQEDEERNQYQLMLVAGWMPTEALIRICGVSVPEKDAGRAQSFAPELFAAWMLEQLPTKLMALNAFRRLLATNLASKRFGLRRPYSSLMGQPPSVWAMIVRYLLTGSEAAEEWLREYGQLGSAKELAADLNARLASPTDLSNKLLVVANSLSNAEEKTLTEIADVLCARWRADHPVEETEDDPSWTETSLAWSAAMAVPRPVVDPQADALWKRVLANVQMELPRATFDTWLRPTSAIALDETVIHIVAPTAYARDWLNHRMRGALKRTLRQVSGMELELDIDAIKGDVGVLRSPLEKPG